MDNLKIGSLFSGTGALDIAVERVTGATPAWFVEHDKAPSKILNHHWPNIPNHGDVTKIDWEEIEPVDIITGGFPCQPFSTAGLRKGKNDDRHLWPYVREAIRHLRPQLAILENVPGLRSLGIDRVLGDLAEDGQHVKWVSVRASEAGAPHHRDRVFIAVSPHANSFGLEERRLPGRSEEEVSGIDSSFSSFQGDGEGVEWGEYGDVIRRWEQVTRPAPGPVTTSAKGKPLLNTGFAEWAMGLPEGHVTSPDIGLSRAQQLKVIGNGVCPQQAELALEMLLDDWRK